jgi:hypothetical protein
MKEKERKKEEKEFRKMSQNIMTNKNKKLLKVIEHGRKEKKDAREKLESKVKMEKNL